MKIFLRVTLCITIIAFSISLPQCALGMPLWQHAAICDQCSNPSVAITQIGITWIYQVTLDSFKQNTATCCPNCPPRHAHVHALLTYDDSSSHRGSFSLFSARLIFPVFSAAATAQASHTISCGRYTLPRFQKHATCTFHIPRGRHVSHIIYNPCCHHIVKYK